MLTHSNCIKRTKCKKMVTFLMLLKGLFTLTEATETETQIFFPSRMGYIGPYGSVHMETCGKGNSNPQGLIQSILSVAVAAVSVNKP